MRIPAIARLALLLLLGAGRSSAAGPQDHRELIRDVVRMLEQQHVAHRNLDDAMSARWFDTLVKDLDPRRMYFTQPDMERLSEWRKTLDDTVANGDLSFIVELRTTIQQRVKEAMPAAEESVDADHDFAANEEMQIAYSDFAKDRSELNERWRKEIKRRILKDRIAGIPRERTARRLKAWIESVREDRAEQSTDEFVASYLDALARSFDPNSRYFSKTMLEEFNIRN